MALALYDIKFRNRTLIKGQALANFLLMEGKFKEEKVTEVKVEDAIDEECILMVDGVSNKFGAAVGIVLITPNLSSVKHAIQLEFPMSNNEVEYAALIAEMLMATELRVKNLRICSDSNLVIGQMTGKF